MTLLKFCLLRNHWCLDLIDLIAVYIMLFLEFVLIVTNSK